AEHVLRYFNAAATKRVLVVGETIIDEYHYCEALGKSGKEPILATRYHSQDKFAGGVLACANHVAPFCGQVDVLTFLGDRDTQEEFVRAKLRPNVSPIFLYKKDSPTIVKQRYVDVYLSQKLFEVYHINDEELNAEQDQALCQVLERILPGYD